MEKYMRLSTKRELIEIDIWFIHQCLKNRVTPIFATVKTSKNVPDKLKIDIETKLMKKEICIHYARLNNINTELKILYNSLVQAVPFDYLQERLNSLQDDLFQVKHNKFQKVHKKLQQLIRHKEARSSTGSNSLEGKFSNFKFHNRLKNLSECSFSQQELDFLNKGLKFSTLTHINTKTIEEFAVDIDALTESLSLSNEVKTLIKHCCFTSLQKDLEKFNNNRTIQTRFLNQQKLIKSISYKIKRHNLIFTKADKGNCLIIMSKQDYINKTEHFLNTNNFEILNRNPMSKFLAHVKETLKQQEQFFSELNINLKKFIHTNSSFPRLYGLPKIHKPDSPMRPVVSFFNTPLAELSKFLNNFLKKSLNYSPKYTVKNSIELVCALNNSQLPLHNFLMVSFDVSNLFTNVPRDETIPIIRNLLISKNLNSSTINQIIPLLQLCLSQDFFSFNSKYYRQPSGLAMGNPLSPLLADLFLDHLENNFIFKSPTSQIFNKIKVWYRYVDDVLAFIEGSPMDTQQILLEINQIHPSISFTLELENNNCINFLDLTLQKTSTKLEFSIFRKSTQTDHLLPPSSNHPFQQKMAALYCYTHRLLNIPMSDTNFNNELNILKQIAVNNEFNPNIVNKLINKINFRFRRNFAYNQNSINSGNITYRSLPYLGPVSNHIASILKKKIENLRISFKVQKTIGSTFTRTKDSIDFLERSGIYKLTCKDCEASYVGRTTRTVGTRIKEHLSRIEKSNFGFHLKFHNHNFSPTENCKILHNIPRNNFLKMNLLEDLEILRELKINPDNCLNTQIQLNCNFKPLFKYFWDS